MLVDTISSRKKELVLLDKEMDIFNCSFTQKENILILRVNDWALQCSKQNLIVSSLFVTYGPQKFKMTPKNVEGAQWWPSEILTWVQHCPHTNIILSGMDLNGRPVARGD